MQVTLNINGQSVTRDVEPRQLLVHFIRDTPGLTGTHWGCDTSNCGACVVLMDDKPLKSCTTLAVMCEGHEIRTVESLEVDGRLDPVHVAIDLVQDQGSATQVEEADGPRAPGSGQAGGADALRGGAQHGNAATGRHDRLNGEFVRHHWAPPFGVSTTGPDAWQKPRWAPRVRATYF